MPVSLVNGIRLGHDDYGTGAPVLLIPGTGAPGRVWKAHQVPALVAAGYRVITVDQRGVPPSDICEQGFTLDDMVCDVAGLIDLLGITPCRVVGFSLGAILTQELLLSRPELVAQAVLMATRGRTDVLGAAMAAGELELFDQGIKIPPLCEAYMRVIQGFSRRTLSNEELVRDWLEVFELSSSFSSLSRSQIMADITDNRLHAYRNIKTPCLVLGFEDDIIIPPYLGREVAERITGSRYAEIAGSGHFGYLEQPGAVNAAILSFFAGASGERK
jgi:pimeloyl-ACP methyl ester carboxylesterase